MGKKTIVYVDGFNLYYGCLRNSPYKWLDLQALFQNILGDKHDIVAIKYFTAHISARGQDVHSPARQKLYLQALEKHIPHLTIYYGHFLTSRTVVKVCQPTATIPSYIEVFKTEEKGSDVNIAIQMLHDAGLNAYECAVLVSNDSDIAEALNLVRNYHKKLVGVIIPHDGKKRCISKQLQKYAHFIKCIRHGNLIAAQLPTSIEGTEIYKPNEW